MPVTAEQIQALRGRHAAIVRQRAGLEGRQAETERALGEALAGVERDYGVRTLDELEALIAREQAQLETDYASAETQLAAAELQARTVGA